MERLRPSGASISEAMLVPTIPKPSRFPLRSGV
jgi:hypothetical protein